MDIRDALMREHSRSQCRKIVNYIGSDKDRFAELMKIFLQGDYRLTQRAAWPVSYCIQENPRLVRPYIKPLLEILEKPGIHNAVTRNIMRLFQYVEIPKRYHGQVLTACFDNISKHDIPVAVKAFSLTVLYNLSESYPEIRAELKLVIEERWDHETAAFRSRAKKILSRI